MNRRSKIISALVIFVIFACQAAQGRAQAVEPQIDLYFPTFNTLSTDPNIDLEKSRQYGFSFGWFSKKFRESEGKYRVGLLIRRKDIRIRAREENASLLGYSANSLQFGVERLVHRRSWVDVSLGIAVGVTTMNCEIDPPKGNPCTYNWFFDKGMYLASPELKFILPISTYWAALIGIRGEFYSESNEFTYPFKSGSVFTAGFEFG